MNHSTSETGVLPFVATLRRMLTPLKTGRGGERCEVCDAALPPDHRHIVDISTRRLLCACEICGVVPPTPAGPVVPNLVGEGGHYRAVPARYVHLPRMTVSAAQWDALAIPVDLAFFFVNSALGRVVACYPGPAGATESLLSLDAWPALADANPRVQALVPDVEALLVRRLGEEYTCFIVPIDACYELAGRIRKAWTGFGGGEAGQRAIEQFFAGILERSAVAGDEQT